MNLASRLFNKNKDGASFVSIFIVDCKSGENRIFGQFPLVGYMNRSDFSRIKIRPGNRKIPIFHMQIILISLVHDLNAHFPGGMDICQIEKTKIDDSSIYPHKGHNLVSAHAIRGEVLGQHRLRLFQVLLVKSNKKRQNFVPRPHPILFCRKVATIPPTPYVSKIIYTINKYNFSAHLFVYKLRSSLFVAIGLFLGSPTVNYRNIKQKEER